MSNNGRPLKYNSPEQMQEAIDRYFETDAFIQLGEAKMFAPTVEGLAYSLGMTRQSLINYEERDGFLDTIKRAKQRVAIALEQRLYSQSVTGAIFNLKNNFGWKDQTQQELTGPKGGPIELSEVRRVIVRPDGSAD